MPPSNGPKPYVPGQALGGPGFTIVEIVVSLALLGFALMAVFGALTACSTATRHARMLTESVLIAERLLVEAQHTHNTRFETRTGQEGLWAWQVRLAPTSIDNLGAIHVQVTWPEQQRQQQYDLYSLVGMRSFAERRF